MVQSSDLCSSDHAHTTEKGVRTFLMAEDGMLFEIWGIDMRRAERDGGLSSKDTASALFLRPKIAFMTRVRSAPTVSSSADEAVSERDCIAGCGVLTAAGIDMMLGMDPRDRLSLRMAASLSQFIPSSSICPDRSGSIRLCSISLRSLDGSGASFES